MASTLFSNMYELGKTDLEINNLVKSLDSWSTQNYYLPFAFWKSFKNQGQCVFKQTQLLWLILSWPTRFASLSLCGTTAALLCTPRQEASFLAE